MAARVQYNAGTPWGQQVARLASITSQAQTLSTRMMAALNSMTAGGTTFTQMETELGLSAGVGTTLYTLLNNAKTNLAVVDISEIDIGTF